MEDILADKLGQGTTMAHYFNPLNESKVTAWDKEYKQLVMLQFFIILTEMKLI